MKEARNLRRAVAELDPAVFQAGGAVIGSRSIYQFWHLYAAHFRSVFLAPRRRPDSGCIAWSWREVADGPALTVAELAEVRHRLSNASRSLAATTGVRSLPGGAEDDDSQEAQIGACLERLTAELAAKPDRALAGYVCRTENGLMLHSWGAPAPANPVFPDAELGGISGSVLVDGAGSSGLTIVLDGGAGHGNPRTTSGRNGVFRFPEVSPGSYRLRVTERNDFPPEGIRIEMERTAISGIELRNNRGAPESPALPAPEGSRRTRRPLGLFILLGLMAAGTVYWIFERRTSGPSVRPKSEAGWQSAKGQLVAASEEVSPAGTGQSGGVGHWAELSHQLPGPVRLGPSPHVSTTHANRAIDAATGMDVPSNLAANRFPAADGARPDTTGPALARSEESSGGDAELRTEPQGSPEPRGKLEANRLEQKNDSTAVAEAAPGRVPRDSPSPDGTRSARPGASAPAITEAPEEPESGKGGSHVSGEGAGSGGAHANTSVGEKVSAIPKNTGNSDAAARSDGQGGATGIAAAAGSASVTNDTSHLAPRAGIGRHDQNGVKDSSATVGLDAGRDAAAPGASAVSQTDSATSTEVGNHGASMATDAAQKDARSADNDARRSANHDSDHPAEAELPQAAPDLTGTGKGVAAGAVNAGGEDFPVNPDDAQPRALISLGTVDATAWRTQLGRDAIVPTFPVPAGRSDPAEEMRQASLAASRAGMPAALRSPITKRGFAVDLPVHGGFGTPRWMGAVGAELTVHGQRAEISWTGRTPPARSAYSLVTGDGREIARVNTDAGGNLRLDTVKNVRGWYWISVAEGPAEPDAEHPRLEWRLASGAPLPESWRRDDQAWRIDIPLEAHAKPTDYTVELADPETGWALVTDVGVH